MAKLLYKYFKAANVRANYVISGREDGQNNEAIIKDFKADKLDVLINVNIVTEGVDVPNVKTVFLTRPTKSKILMTQMIGRGLRGQKVGGTEVTYIVDFLDKWRDELVAWVIPEKLYEEEKNIGLTLPPPVKLKSEKELSDWEILHTISEGKFAEFIQLANSRFDLSLFEQFSLIERVPLGYYDFDYEVIGDDGEGGTKTCSVMVYDCMKAKFDELIDWLNNRPDERFFDIEAMADEIDEKFFGEREELLGYSKENICDILRFYSQKKGESPQFVEFAKRAEYDVSALAQHITDANYIEDEWNRPDGKWKNFFGEQNKMAFLAAITAEVAKSAGLLKKSTNALTDAEIQTAQDVALDVLVTRHSGIYENARENGEYVDSQNSHRSDNRLDFEVDYKVPLSAGGKTVFNNLHLVYKKSDSVILPSPPPLPPAVNCKMVDELLDKLAKSTDGKMAIKNEIIATLSKLKEEAQQNRDAVAMNKIGNYYGEIDKRDEAGRCYRSAKEFRSETPSSTTIIIPPVKPKGEPIPNTNLTWRLADDGTLTISGKGNMGYYIILEKTVTWNELNKLIQQDVTLPWRKTKDLIKKVVIEPGVTSIGNYAFSYCNNLTEVKIADTITKIAFRAFEYCDSLKEVILPDSVIKVGECAFYYCKNRCS